MTGISEDGGAVLVAAVVAAYVPDVERGQHDPDHRGSTSGAAGACSHPRPA
jgi:hypothetical protein